MAALSFWEKHCAILCSAVSGRYVAFFSAALPLALGTLPSARKVGPRAALGEMADRLSSAGDLGGRPQVGVHRPKRWHLSCLLLSVTKEVRPTAASRKSKKKHLRPRLFGDEKTEERPSPAQVPPPGAAVGLRNGACGRQSLSLRPLPALRLRRRLAIGSLGPASPRLPAVSVSFWGPKKISPSGHPGRPAWRTPPQSPGPGRPRWRPWAPSRRALWRGRCRTASTCSPRGPESRAGYRRRRRRARGTWTSSERCPSTCGDVLVHQAAGDGVELPHRVVGVAGDIHRVKAGRSVTRSARSIRSST